LRSLGGKSAAWFAAGVGVVQRCCEEHRMQCRASIRDHVQAGAGTQQVSALLPVCRANSERSAWFRPRRNTHHRTEEKSSIFVLAFFGDFGDI